LLREEIKHGPVEALFTIDEETGMTGAFELKPGVLKGDILLNMDSEDEGELYIGCAGGTNANAKIRFQGTSAPAGHDTFRLTVKASKAVIADWTFPWEEETPTRSSTA